MKNLEQLSVTRNELRHLPNNIGQLESLEFLNVNHNKLQDLPVSLAQLTNLVELDVANNAGTLVIPNMSECSRLERIYVDSFTMIDDSYNPRGNRVEIIVVR